eukprot:5383455-Prymnesium_polylepis.1
MRADGAAPRANARKRRSATHSARRHAARRRPIRIAAQLYPSSTSSSSGGALDSGVLRRGSLMELSSAPASPASS